jgi:hypothetical protein
MMAWIKSSLLAGGRGALFDRLVSPRVFFVGVRPRTLLLVTSTSRHYLGALAAQERQQYEATSRLEATHLARLGFCAVEIGPTLDAADYADWLHLAEAGGNKMAELVAPRVRALAEQLGYTK